MASDAHIRGSDSTVQQGTVRYGDRTLLSIIGVVFAIFLIAVLWTVTKREQAVPMVSVEGGDATRGQIALHTYGCGACHTIPGIDGAVSKVGPALNGLAQRSFIAGKLHNSPEALALWIQHPQAIDPGNAMPEVGVTDATARDMAAYLYTLP